MSICNHQADSHFTCGLMSDLEMCRYWKKEYGHAWHTISLLRPGVIKRHKLNWDALIDHFACKMSCEVWDVSRPSGPDDRWCNTCSVFMPYTLPWGSSVASPSTRRNTCSVFMSYTLPQGYSVASPYTWRNTCSAFMSYTRPSGLLSCLFLHLH